MLRSEKVADKAPPSKKHPFPKKDFSKLITPSKKYPLLCSEDRNNSGVPLEKAPLEISNF